MMVVAVLVLALAACTEPPAVRAEEVCDALCTCEAPLAPDRTTCTNTCNAQLATIAIPDSCLACLDEPLCTDRTTCLDACLPFQGTP
jgi:hypothetical protein